MGGPPIELLVPINPDKKPAENKEADVGLKTTLLRLSPTATITVIPNQRASCSCEIQNSNNPPATVPGIRPMMANFSPSKEIECQCLAALANDKVNAEIVIGAGT